MPDFSIPNRTPEAESSCRLWIPSELFRTLSELIDPEDVLKPDYFVSHAWQGRFINVVAAVFSRLRNASDDTAVWLDIIAVNQHNDTRPASNAVLLHTAASLCR